MRRLSKNDRREALAGENRENREVAFSGEAANDDSLGLSERPAAAGSAALGNGALMSLALKARKN